MVSGSLIIERCDMKQIRIFRNFDPFEVQLGVNAFLKELVTYRDIEIDSSIAMGSPSLNRPWTQVVVIYDDTAGNLKVNQEEQRMAFIVGISLAVIYLGAIVYAHYISRNDTCDLCGGSYHTKEDHHW